MLKRPKIYASPVTKPAINTARVTLFRYSFSLEQWFPNCGTRATCGTRIGLFSVLFHKKYIHSYCFYLSGSLNNFLNEFCVLSLLVF